MGVNDAREQLEVCREQYAKVEAQTVDRCIQIALYEAMGHENRLKSDDSDWRWEQGGYSAAHRIARAIREAFE